jgi:predicted transposase/invertase (TIGR01784 family)
MSALKDKYINPLTDFGFKKLFGTEPNKILLIDFLNQILPERHQIKDLSYSRNEHLGLHEMDLKFIYIELPKFKKQEDELETQFDKWLYVFRHLSNLQDRPKKLQDRIFQKLFEAAEIARFTPEERNAYEDSLKYYRDLKNVVDTSREEGVLEGIEKIAKKMKEKGMSNAEISELTGLNDDEISKL